MANVLATTIRITNAELTLGVGNTRILIAKLTPANSDSEITWTTSNDTKAIVDNGIITGLAATGDTPVVITATANGHTATCNVKVVANYEIVSLAEAKIRLSIDFNDRDNEIKSRIQGIIGYLTNATGFDPDNYGNLDDIIQGLLKEYILSALYYDYYDAHNELNDKRLTAIIKQLQVIR